MTDLQPGVIGSAPAGLCIGVDIGGSNARVALVEEHRVISELHMRTGRRRSAEDVCSELAGAVRALIQHAGANGVRAIGVGVAGQVDPSQGAVRYAPNLDWHDVPLRQCLADALERPVAVLNDVQAAAFGESSYGAARGASDAVVLFVGTGVGGGIISGGELVRGCDGSAGEFGHTVVQLDGPLCRCGQHGCLEALAGGWAIAARAREAIAARPAAGARLLELAGGAPESVTAEVVGRAAEEGDTLARSLVHQVGSALGAAVASIANAFNPCVIVLGGGVIEGIPMLLELVDSATRKRALPAAARSLQVLPAALRGHAGVVGAATWAGGHL